MQTNPTPKRKMKKNAPDKVRCSFKKNGRAKFTSGTKKNENELGDRKVREREFILILSMVLESTKKIYLQGRFCMHQRSSLSTSGTVSVVATVYPSCLNKYYVELKD